MLDVIYSPKNVVLNTDDTETPMDMVEIDMDSSEDERGDDTNDIDLGFVVKLTTNEEVEIAPEYGDRIRKVCLKIHYKKRDIAELC